MPATEWKRWFYHRYLIESDCLHFSYKRAQWTNQETEPLGVNLCLLI